MNGNGTPLPTDNWKATTENKNRRRCCWGGGDDRIVLCLVPSFSSKATNCLSPRAMDVAFGRSDVCFINVNDCVMRCEVA